MAGRYPSRGLALSLGLTLIALLTAAPRPVAAAEPAGYEYFHTYAETEAVIDNVVAVHPNVAHKFSIGQSYEGRQIWGVKLTANVDQATNGRPEVFINGLMHARERASSELAIYMLQVLANNYGLAGKLGGRVTAILNNTVVYIVPMMNPDGAEYDFSAGQFHKWRKNRQPTPDSTAVGIDLNRQFGFTWNCCGGSSGNPASNTYRGPSAWYTPEDRAYRDFVDGRVVDGTQRITEILSLHSAARQVLWPYSYTKEDVPSTMTVDDHQTFVALGRGVAQRNGYKPQQGSDLYIVDGDQDDWAFHEHGIFALTIEMSKGRAKRYYPSRRELNADLNRNRGAVLWYLEQADCPYRMSGLADKYCANSSNASYYSQSVYNSNAVQPQQTNCWCVVASTQAMLEHIDASISVAQTDVNDYMTPLDKNNWTDPAFRDYLQCSKGFPSPSFAHDGRGMSWALWQFATPDQSMGFNEYLDTDQAQMSWRIVRGIRATGQPVGIMAAHGRHAILAVGYQTTLDPLDEGGLQNTLLGVRVWDPWYGAGFGNWSGWPSGGFAGDSYVTLDDWNSKYFTTDLAEGAYYDGMFVAVMRSSVAGPPSDYPAQSYGDWMYSQPPVGPTSLASPRAASFNAPASAPTISQAVADGLRAHALLGDPDLGNLPATFTVGNSVRIASMARELPSYDLVEIRVAGAVRAVALVNETSAGYVFGELRATTGDVRLPSPTQLQSQLAANGLHGTPSLSWTWTDDPAPPFAPFLTGLDASGRNAFVTPRGVVEQLPIVRGLTPATN